MVEIGISLALGVICYLYGLWEGLRKGKSLTIKALVPEQVIPEQPPQFYPDASSNHKTQELRNGKRTP